ncbi:MAG: transcription factor IIB, partial [Thermoproteus sp.]
LDPETAWAAASKPYEKEARNYASAFKISVTDRTAFEGIVYYPFWKLKYIYRGKEYNAVVDAAEGNVVYMEYPISRRGRAASLVASIAILTGSVVLGTAIGMGISAAKGVDLTLWGLLGGLIGGIAGSASAFTYVVERKAVYREGQEIEIL